MTVRPRARRTPACSPHGERLRHPGRLLEVVKDKALFGQGRLRRRAHKRRKVIVVRLILVQVQRRPGEVGNEADHALWRRLARRKPVGRIVVVKGGRMMRRRHIGPGAHRPAHLDHLLALMLGFCVVHLLRVLLVLLRGSVEVDAVLLVLVLLVVLRGVAHRVVVAGLGRLIAVKDAQTASSHFDHVRWKNRLPEEEFRATTLAKKCLSNCADLETVAEFASSGEVAEGRVVNVGSNRPARLEKRLHRAGNGKN
mmetsp:Transcript_47328/g.111598  ORF Transcript_47328/g.111598 Transcript_47328/m.111598 type:complete len:254 (+) Transcript_47328:389-1150(+)